MCTTYPNKHSSAFIPLSYVNNAVLRKWPRNSDELKFLPLRKMTCFFQVQCLFGWQIWWKSSWKSQIPTAYIPIKQSHQQVTIGMQSHWNYTFNNMTRVYWFFTDILVSWIEKIKKLYFRILKDCILASKNFMTSVAWFESSVVTSNNGPCIEIKATDLDNEK